MSGTGEYALGVAALAAIALAMAVAGRTARRRLLPGWTGPPAMLAAGLLALAALAVISELLGLFGLLDGVVLTAACLIVGAGALRLEPLVISDVRRERARARDLPGCGDPARLHPDAGQRDAPPVATWELVAALALAGLVALQWAGPTLLALDRGIYGGDSLWYHMPFAAHIAQTGSVTELLFTDPLYLNWFYPQVSELLHADGLMLLGNDFLSPLLNLVWLGVALEAGNAWEPLCAFLGVPPVTNRRFPHTNAQRYDATDHAWARRLRALTRSAAAPAAAPAQPRSGATLGVRHCVKCGLEHPAGEESRRTLIARLPLWAKHGYRGLQRRVFVPPPGADRTARRLAALRAEHPALDPGSLAAVTTFFNPGGYRSRVDNYGRFRESLAASGVPLVTVELAFGNDPFMLHGDEDPDRHVRVRAQHVMWQKERLLNLGIRRLLDRGYTKIVWLDADVVFEEPEWPWFVAAALEKFPVCQVFGQVLVEQGPGESPRPGVSAARYFGDTGARIHLDRRRPTWQRPFGYPMGYSGFGWAARADVLERVPLYDRAVVGGGDKLIQVASHPFAPNWEKSLGRLLQSTRRPCPRCAHTNASPAYVDDYLAWARRWNEACGGSAGWTDLTIRSLFHGEHRNRFYTLRRDILLRHEYDPAADVACDEQGCWRWTSAKPGLHLDVANYFFERREDS